MAARAAGPPPTPNSQARCILDLAAHGAPGQPLPLALLRRAAGGDAVLNDAAIDRLCVLGLASPEGEDSTLLVHRLVAAFARARQAAPSALADALALALVCETYAANDSGLPARMLPLLPHAQFAAEAAAARGSRHAAVLLNNLGAHFDALANYDQARALYERALRILEAQLGADHHIATLVNNLGMVAHDQGDLPGARALFARALQIDEASYGPDHPNVAIPLNNLGLVAKAQGDLPGARALFERALQIDEASYGPNHPNVARDVNNLGIVAQDQGDLTGAWALLERALQIDQATYDPDHPNVARDVNNLGMVALEQGDLPGARALFERALRIFEAKLGANHPNTQDMRDNLAVVLAAIAAQSL